MGRPRPWIAAALALLYPGLGHVYLQRWARALLWFALAVGTAIVAIPDGALPDVSATDPGSVLAAADVAITEASTFGLVTIVVVVAFSIVDAYAIGRHIQTVETDAGDAGGEGSISCPSCGRDLDEDLDFCHWCTTRLDDGPSEE